MTNSAGSIQCSCQCYGLAEHPTVLHLYICCYPNSSRVYIMYVCMPVHVDSPIRLKQFLVVCTLKYYGNDIIKCSKHKQFLGTFHSTKISGNSGRRSKRTESFWRLFSKILVNPLVPNFQTFFLFYLTFSLGMTWTYKCSSSSCKCCPDQSLQDGGVTKPLLLFRVLLHIG